jgi:hypothetical protein
MSDESRVIGLKVGLSPTSFSNWLDYDSRRVLFCYFFLPAYFFALFFFFFLDEF